MIKDVAPELLKQIRNDFKIKFEESEKIKELYDLITLDSATYREVNEFAIETGRILAIVLSVVYVKCHARKFGRKCP